MKFKKVELHAFRAYKNKENGTFDFTLPNNKVANFVSIYAPNGFGKTSFYDGVEWAVTNNISRLDIYEKISKAERKYTEKENGNREKQYILKNNLVDDKIKGYVKVWINSKVFKNTIPHIARAGSNDYFSNTKITNEYFKNVILSQEGIDNFLKEDDDKERYKKFISHFGNQKLDTYYENIEKLEKKNNHALKEIKKEINDVKKNLDKEIDDSIFESTNKKIEEINLKNNEKLNLIDNSFDEIKKGELETKLFQQKKQLSEQIEYIENKMLPKIPNWIIDSEKYFKDKNEWKKLKVKINDFNELVNIINNIKAIQNKIDKDSLTKEEHEELEKIYPKYKDIQSEINKIRKSINELNDTKTKDESSLTARNVKQNEISKKIELLNNEKKKINELLIEIPVIYKNIEKIQKYNSERKILEENLAKLHNTKEAIKNNVFIGISSNEKYKLKIENIELLIEQNRLNEEKLISMRNTKNQYQQYNQELKQLISLGVQVIDNTQKDTCPLCHTKHESYSVLKNKVLNNPLLNILEKELLEKEKKMQYQININNKKIEEKKSSIFSELNKEVDKTKDKLSTIEYQIKSIYPNMVENIDSILQSLINKIENKTQDELVKIKKKRQTKLHTDLVELNQEKENLEDLEKEKSENIILIGEALKIYKKDLCKLQNKEEYLSISNYINTFEDIKINVLERIKKDVNKITKILNEKKIKLNRFNEKKASILNKYSLENLDKIINELELLKNKEFKLYATNILTFESDYEQFFKNKIIDIDSVKEDIKSKGTELNDMLKSNKIKVNLMNVVEKNTDNLLKAIENKKLKKQLENYEREEEKKDNISTQLNDEKKRLEEKINKDVEAFFHEDLINKIYEKIDPHPEYKKVKFECHFEDGKGKLNVFVDNNDGTEHRSPSLYYSTAQLNVLSLSIFLAKALNTKDDEGNDIDCIFIDDPIQSMDSINILATIDLLRSLVINHNKQIILSTHDENFHYLLQKKIPKEFSKFIELETYGKVKMS